MNQHLADFNMRFCEEKGVFISRTNLVQLPVGLNERVRQQVDVSADRRPDHVVDHSPARQDHNHNHVSITRPHPHHQHMTICTSKHTTIPMSASQTTWWVASCVQLDQEECMYPGCVANSAKWLVKSLPKQVLLVDYFVENTVIEDYLWQKQMEMF